MAGRHHVSGWPWLTAGVVAVTGTFTGFQFAYPALLLALGRSPALFSRHEDWRLITPILVHDGGGARSRSISRQL